MNAIKDIEKDKKIRKGLPHTWIPFFGSFGKLKNIQRLTIPFILEGENVVISSPKATGKTEAVLAPVIERWLENPKKSLSVIYISPTRALVNDIYKRVKPAFDYLDIPLSRRTGDHPEFRRERITPFLITTPESLDSLISRYPAVFKEVDAVIIDEVHLLHNSYRGDQLRILLNRLKKIVKEKPNIYVMSATISDPQSIGRNFIEEEFKIAIEREPIIVEYYLLKGTNFIEEIQKEAQRRNLKKLLFFVNSRYEAEETAKMLSIPPFGRNVWVHHGSMSRREREEVESLINKAKIGVCVATSTLEFGIDIGDIDAIVLITPPRDAASLLQRLGRGNRSRENYVLAYGIYLDEIQKIIFEQLFEDAENEDYLSLSHTFDLSVVCQQAFSYLYQKRRVGTSIDALERLFCGIVSCDDIEKITGALLDKRLIKMGKSRLLYPGEGIGNAIIYGGIHSNIPDKKEFEVYDVTTGRMIGKVENPFPSFTLSGRDWMVVSWESGRVWVRHQDRKGGAKNVFTGRRYGFWDYRFGIRLKKRLLPQINEHEIPYIRRGNYLHIFHFTGPIYSFIWSYALREKKRIADVGDIFFVSEDTEIIPQKIDIENAARETSTVVTHYMNLGRYFGLLPKELRENQVLSSLKIDEFADWLSRIKIVKAEMF
jgi:ATP-dependent Lhr-like helicase